MVTTASIIPLHVAGCESSTSCSRPNELVATVCVSLAAEWIEHEEDEKQDGELKAFARLAEPLTRRDPRLPICLVADGLSPNLTCFRFCQEHGWSWMVTFKDGNLPSVWTRVGQRQALKHGRRKEACVRHGHSKIQCTSAWHPRMTSQGVVIHGVACEDVVEQERPRFVSLSRA